MSNFVGARPIVRQAWAHMLRISGCLWWAKRQLRRRGSVIVLTFHRVLNDVEFRHTCSLPGIVVRRETFERLAAYVVGKYEAVDFEGATGARVAGKLRVMFTFDDGWMDNRTNALPVARSHGIPLTIFVCPGLLSRTQPFWPERVAALLRNAGKPAAGAEIETRIETLKAYSAADREAAIARLCETHAPDRAASAREVDRTVSWEDIREMEAAGVRFGAHTQTHEILPNTSAEIACREVRESKRALEANLFHRCLLFAYPNGNNSAATRHMLSEAGYSAAFTTEQGPWNSDCDPLAIPRVNVCEEKVTGLTGHFSPALFQYTVFWKAWRAMRVTPRLPARSRREAVLSEA